MEIRIERTLQAVGLLLFIVVFAGHAFAGSITVQSTAVIYAAGSQSSVAGGAGGTVPGGISLSSGGSYITFSSVTGSLTSACGSSAGCISRIP